MAGFAALTVYKMEKPDAVTAEKLGQFAFRPVAGEEKALGWTSIDDLTDTEWQRSVPEKGGFMAFALRVDTRKVPAPVLKLHLEGAFRQEEAKNAADGKAFISRARKKELKELCAAKLMSKAEPVPASADVAVDTSSGLVYVGSTSTSMLEAFEEYFERSFKAKAERLFWADPSEGCRVLRLIYDSPQSVEFDGLAFTVRMSDSEAVSLAAAGGEASAVNSKAALQSVEAGLAEGLEIVKLHIQMENEGVPEDACTFTLNSEFAFSGLKVPVPARSDDDDPDAAFLEKMFLISRVVGVMADLLTREGGKE